MRDPNRLEQLAREANAYTKEPLPPVERVRRDSIATTPVDQADARESLISQRTGSVYYRDPAKQKRNILRSKKDKAALANTDNWSYTKAERYAVLDQQIRKGGPAGLAQAVLAFDPTDRLDVDVGYVANENGDAICTNKPNGWLDLVAGRNGRNDVAYIRLLTSFGASNASRDKALKVALEHGAMETAQELLRNDADPNSAGVAGHFLAAIRDLNQYLYTMFLTATKPLNAFYINQALVEAVSRDSDLVALLIAHGADGLLDDGQALRAAIKERNLQEAAMILINPESDNSLFETSLNIATNVACAIQDEKTKVKFLDILFSAGADPNTPSVQDELLEAVLKHQMSLLKLFIYHGTSPDRNDAEGLRLAVISGQTELVEILLEGAVPETSTSRALDEANGLEDTDIYEEIVKALIEKGVSQTSLSKCLANAVDKGSSSLAPLLIEKGATLDYDNARCVRTALKRHDFSLFGTLLEGSCQPSILAQAIPDAMKIQPSSERLDIMTRLLAKGVSGKELDIALQTVAGSAREQTDYSLIETLMRFNASVDFRDENGNCVYNAAKAQDERVLDLLSQGDPSPDTVSVAIGLLPVSFATAEAVEYERQVGMMTTLLEKGARGTTVAELLITAARDDHREKALRALIHYGADANYQYGRALEEALKLPRISALEIICTGCRIERDSFVAQLPNSLKPDGFSLEKATFFAHASTSYGYTGIFDQPLLDEVGKNGNRREVIELLLSLGASVNFENGRALQHAVSAGNVEVCRLLVAGVKHSNISRAFPATSEITDKPIRYQLMKVLLEAGGLGIGQDEALVQASREATPDDLSHVELLLEHQASADFNKGEAVLQSIQTKNLPLLKRLIRTKLNEKTLAKAFNLAREPGYTTDERYNMFEALLEVYSDDKEVSKALIEAVLRDHNDIKTASLLLDHGASLESQDGLAMQVVAAGGSLELLNLFLSKQPGQKFRSASFRATMDSGLNAKQRIPIYQSLLETGITQDLISAALLQAAQAKIPDQSLLNLLIDFDASLDYDAGSALFGITTRGDLSTLEVLLRGNVSQRQTLDRSFSAAMELAGANRLTIAMALLKKEPGVSRGTISQHLAQIVQQIDYDLLGLMMDYQPDPALNGGESLILAARAGDVTAARILTRVEIPSDTINRAFERLLDSRAIQSNLDGLETARTLLSLGITQQLVDRALLDGFDGAINQLTKDLVELLIPYRPNVSGGEGKIFVDTANSKEVELFRRLASENPDLNIVIPALIRSLLNEEELISWLVHLEECAQRGSTSLQDFVIFTALAQFPQGNQLVTHLLNHGCRANSKTDFELSRPSGIENMTILIWALNHRNISEEVIMGILEKGHEAEVAFETPVSHATATIFAAIAGKNTVLRRLIELRVDVNHCDNLEHSALFYASRNGHLATAELLIQARAKADDGSLHEAAREAQPQVIELLRANGHRRDFPSAIHADGQYGRTALEELCLKARSGTRTGNWQKRIHDSIALLLPAQIADIPKSGGKTMLHLALENESSAVDVTRELLGFPAVWENINNPIYLYQDAQGYVYSPTKYVELLFLATNLEKCQQLTTLLRARKCNNRFYAHTVNQPDGAVGLPEDVADAVNKQKRADHEQREELKRRDEIAAHQRAIEAEDFELNAIRARERHEVLIQQLEQQEGVEKQAARNKHALALRQEQELQRERQDALISENRIRSEGVREEGALRHANADREQEAELAHRRILDQREASALQSKLAYEKQMISARETASRNEYQRQVDLCGVKDRSAHYQAEQRGRNNYN